MANYKLKPLCIRKIQSHWCFKHINMQCLPEIHKNSFSAWMTCDSFAFWFECEFVLSERCHLCFKKLEEKALLLLDHCPAHPSADGLKLKNGMIKTMFLPKNTTVLIWPMDQSIIRACKTYYCSELLSGLVNSELQNTEFLNTLMLKEAAYSVGLAWERITPTTIVNCWKKCIGKDGAMAGI